VIAATLAALGALLLVVSFAAPRLAGRRPSRSARRSPRLDLAGSVQSFDAVTSSNQTATRLGPYARHRSDLTDLPSGASRPFATSQDAALGSEAGPGFRLADEWVGPGSRPVDRRMGPAAQSADRRVGAESWSAEHRWSAELFAGPPRAREPGVLKKPARQSRRQGVHRGRILLLIVSGGAATVAVSLLVGSAQGLLLLAGIGGTVVIKQAVARRAASRLRAERAAAAPAVIDLLSACMLAGLNPYRSLVRVAERSPGALRTELRRAAAELDMGRTPAAALRAVGERTNLHELRACRL
jgi:hypothetical protein